jgi:P2 family phage contractile tail tube protein
MSNPVPERLINFRVYEGNNNLLGVATIELPDIEAMTDTISGAGIAGEIDSPILGHFQSMSTTIAFRTIESGAMKLAGQKSWDITARGSQQINDAGRGEYTSKPVRVSMKGITKRNGLGSFEVGSTTDSEVELEITYLKIFIDNVEVLELDKYNFRYVVDGVNYLASVAEDLGL